MKPLTLKRTLNRLSHLGGLVAANHGTLASLVPPHVRRADEADELEAPSDRAWFQTLKASEALQRRLQRLSDRLTGDDDEAAPVDDDELG